MSPPERPEPGRPEIEQFLGEPTRDLSLWRWLWKGDHPFPIRSHRGILGRVIVAFKRVLRPLVRAPQADLWDRQRTFNLVALEYLEQLTHNLEQVRGDLLRDLREVRSDLLRDVQNNHRRISHLEAFKREGYGDVMRHSDALYAVIDQKLEGYRSESRELWSRLGSLIARVSEQPRSVSKSSLAEAWNEQAYLELEDRFRGTRAEISERVEAYLPYLPKQGAILDLGCGRGELLAVLVQHGYAARGVDLSQEMIDHCREQGLQADRGDLLQALRETPAGSLAAVVSLQVIEHLPTDVLGQLVSLAWGALEPGGALVIETPNPLSLVVAARNFWRDPTHRRPVHPETLALLFEQAGFDPVERLDLHPFAATESLPELALDDLGAEARLLAHRANELRDRLDALLFGFQDYAMIGRRA